MAKLEQPGPSPPERGLVDQTIGFGVGFGEGVAKGALSMVEGLASLGTGAYDIATDPMAREKAWEATQRAAEKTEQYGEAAVSDPEKVYRDARDVTNGLYQKFDAARQEASARGESPEFWGKVTGRSSFEVGAIGAGALKVAKVGEASQLAKSSKLGQAMKAERLISPPIPIINSLAETTRGPVSAIESCRALKSPLNSGELNELLSFKEAGIKATRILPGSANRIAIIGRPMPAVRGYAKALRRSGGHRSTEIFDGHVISRSAKKEFKRLKREFGENIPPEVLQKSKMYNENLKWAQKLQQDGYTIVDIGDPYQLETSKRGPSPFYRLEHEEIDFTGAIE